MDLEQWAIRQGYKIAWGSIASLRDALTEFEGMSLSGKLNELQQKMVDEWVTQDYSGDGTIILVAYSTANQSSRITFDFDGEAYSMKLPPCYGDGGASWEYENSLEKRLAEYLSGYGYRVKRFSGPYKHLAAQLGLGKYGRNNLIYIDGFGSYLRIVGFVINDQLSPETYPGNLDKKYTLELCDKCQLCRRHCPTSAIREERFQLNVDRCLSYLNENVDIWPEFVGKVKNECLVGCVVCQNVCPYNRGFTDIGTEKRQRFEREETTYILGQHCEEVPQSIIDGVYKKFEEMGLARYKSFILRNIRAALA